MIDSNWVPGFGEIYTWFAVDRNGFVAVMVNNCYGDLPRKLLAVDDFNVLLDSISEYIWEESGEYFSYPRDRCGDFVLDFYSSWRYKGYSKSMVRDELLNDLAESGNYSETNLSVNKGLFVYHAVEGSVPGEDYPVGFEGETKMGDYFRYLVPTKFSHIDEFPVSLRKGFVRSKNLDFMLDRVIESSKINDYFKELLWGES
jgi:hypothetical protein